MNAEQLGIGDLVPLVVFGFKLRKEIKDDFADNKFTLQEGLGLIDNFMQVPDLLSKKDSIIAQAKDLSLQEVPELIAAVGEDLDNEKVINLVTKSLNWIVATKDLVEEVI